jgi:hypothetical protein
MWQLLAIPVAAFAYYEITKKKPVAAKTVLPQAKPKVIVPAEAGKPAVISVPVAKVTIPITPDTASVPVPKPTVRATVDPVTKVVTIPEVEIVGTATLFNPGPEPKFSPTPAGGLNVTQAHKDAQKDLLTWARDTGFQVPGDSAQHLPSLIGNAYNASDITGKIDPRTRSVTWLFQRFYNFFGQPGDFVGTADNTVFVPKPIVEDGLFGPQTNTVLKKWVTP